MRQYGIQFDEITNDVLQTFINALKNNLTIHNGVYLCDNDIQIKLFNDDKFIKWEIYYDYDKISDNYYQSVIGAYAASNLTIMIVNAIRRDIDNYVKCKMMTFDELISSGKSFKEINKIIKERE